MPSVRALQDHYTLAPLSARRRKAGRASSGALPIAGPHSCFKGNGNGECRSVTETQRSVLPCLEVPSWSRFSSMSGESDLSQEAFDRLLAWLNPDRALAGEKYEEIRRRLIKIFTCRGCTCPEVLADETINRVARKVQEIAATYVGDRSLYFYGVARNVHLEFVRKRPAPEPPPIPEPCPESEQEYECLERCMQNLSSSNRDLILQYYQEEKQAKIDHRNELARRLRIGLNALRIQVYRIRVRLQKCVVECLKQAAPV